MLKPALVASLLLVSGCSTVRNTVDSNLAQATPQTGAPGEIRESGIPHCELVNGTRGCTGAATVAAPEDTRNARVAAMTLDDCTRSGAGEVGRAWGMLLRGDVPAMQARCRELMQAAASAPASPPGADLPLAATAARPAVQGGGACSMTPTCQAQLAERDRLIARYDAQMIGRGVGAQYGYAWCSANETERAARACAASLRAAGQAGCAAQIDASADAARQAAQQAVIEGRAVGVDASRVLSCR